MDVNSQDAMKDTSDDEWVLTASAPALERLYLANGYMSTAADYSGGVLKESEPAPCYVRGVYVDRGYGGIDRLASIPCWSLLRYGHAASVESYRRELDLRHGTLLTSLTLRDERGTLEVRHEMFISRADQHQAAVRVTVRPSFDGEIIFFASLDSPSVGDVEILELAHDDDALSLRGLVRTHAVSVSEALRFEAIGAHITFDRDTDRVSAHLTFDGRAGKSITAVQLVRVATSLETPDPLALALQRGGTYDHLKAEHEAAWERLWSTDIEIVGDPAAQQFARSALFYLWSSVRENDRWSIAPMGLSSNGYNGHIFWDAELWMYPTFLVTHPDLARACVAYREQTMQAAKDRARSNGFRGAQFPWEGGFTGEEMTPEWAETRDFQIHITADVAIAQWWYYLNTGDLQWLRQHGFPIIKECADFWVSRVEHNVEAERYELSDVVCADEYAAHVNNDAFTNASVRSALLIADRAAALCNEPSHGAWRAIANKLYIPYDEQRQVHMEYDGYDGRVTKQADVELLAYPLEHVLDPEQIARDLDFYGQVIDPDGPAMSFSVYSIVSAQLGRAAAAYDYFKQSYLPNTHPPFQAFSETPSNREYFFCTGIGGSLQSVLFGFSGLRLREGYFSLDPLLPPGWQSLHLRNLYVVGRRTSVRIQSGSICIERETALGDSVALTLYRTDQGVEVATDQQADSVSVLAFALTDHGEEPVNLEAAPLLHALHRGLRLKLFRTDVDPDIDVVLRQEEQVGRPLHWTEN